MCDTPIHMGDKKPNQEEDHCATKQVQTDLETAVVSSGNPQLLMPSIYQTCNLSLIILAYLILVNFGTPPHLFGPIKVYQKVRNKKPRTDKNWQFFVLSVQKKGHRLAVSNISYAF